jgi:hypothetical protein
MTTVAIAEAKIKLAWREKYLTDGTNERGLASPRGAYRGYWLSPRLAPDTWLRLIIDPYAPPHAVDKDQFAVIADRTNGWSVSVRETTDVEFNCVDLFPVVGATESWYVYIEAAYTPNVATTANYRVAKTDPHLIASPNYDPNAAILGVIPMTLGDLAINFVVMPPPAGMYDRRCVPSPTARQLVADYVDGDEPWGLFDGLSKWCLGTGATSRYFAEPNIVTKTTVAATKFQLTGTYYVGRDASNQSAGKYFQLMDNYPQYDIPIAGSDAGQIVAAPQVLRSDGITVLTPAADADAEGFYTDPWVQFDFTNTVDVSYSGTFWVFCYEKKTLLTMDNTPASGFPVGAVEKRPHANSVYAKAKAGTPTPLGAGTIDAQLTTLINGLNARIESVHYNGAPGNWVRIWRSHNTPVDANITKHMSSLYSGDRGLLLILGGYIDLAAGPTQWDVIAGIGAGNVTAFYLASDAVDDRLNLMTKTNPMAGSSWDVDTGWDNRASLGATGFGTQYFRLEGPQFEPYNGIEWDQSVNPDSFNILTPDAGGDQTKYEQAPAGFLASPRFRRYFTRNGTVFLSNCYYDAAGDLVADDDSDDAFKMKFSEAGVTFARKDSLDIVGVIPWADAYPGWTTMWTLGVPSGVGTSAYTPFTVYGELIEHVRFGWRFNVPVGDAGPKTFSAAQGITWHVRIPSPPNSFNITINDESILVDAGGDWTNGSISVVSFDSWGAIVEGVTKSDGPWVQDDVCFCYGDVQVED